MVFSTFGTEFVPTNCDKTNGMVEKANDTIKSGTIKRIEYNDKEQMNINVMFYLVHYNLYRRHGSLRKELNVKTPFEAIEKWYKLNSKIFTQNPMDFKNKILSSSLIKQVVKQQ